MSEPAVAAPGLAPRSALVTGANGFIARRVVDRLVRAGYDVRGVDLQADPGRGVVRIAVRDRRAGRPRQRVADADDESGRGLLIVGVLADDWGYEHSAGGNTVWAEFTARRSTE